MSTATPSGGTLTIDPAELPPLGPGQVPVGLTPEELAWLHERCRATALDERYFEFFHGVSEWRRIGRANRRAAQFAAALGEEAARAGVAKVEREFRDDVGPVAWRAFTGGAAEVAEFRAAVEALDHKIGDPSRRGPAVAYLREHPTRVYIDEDHDVWFWAPDQAPGSAGTELCLKLRSLGGIGTTDREVRMPVPDGWARPYGLK